MYKRQIYDRSASEFGKIDVQSVRNVIAASFAQKDNSDIIPVAKVVAGSRTGGYFVRLNSAGNALEYVQAPTDTNTQLSAKQVQDIVGAMVSGNTETGIQVAYQSSDGTLDFIVQAGSSTFLGLTGTPGTWGNAGQYLRVNSGRTALEWVNAPTGGSGDDAFNWATEGNNDVIPLSKKVADS